MGEDDVTYVPSSVDITKGKQNHLPLYTPTPISDLNEYAPSSVLAAYTPRCDFGNESRVNKPNYAPLSHNFGNVSKISTYSNSASSKSCVKRPIEDKEKKDLDVKKTKIAALYKDLFVDSDSSDEEKTLTKPEEKNTSIHTDLPRGFKTIVETEKKPLSSETSVRIFSNQPLGVNESSLKALEEEQGCIDKSSTRTSYLNAVIERLRSFKRQMGKQILKDTMSANKTAIEPVNKIVQNKESIVLRPLLQKPISDGTRPLSIDEKIAHFVRTARIYGFIDSHLMTNDQLKQHNFPLESSQFGEATLTVPHDVAQDLPEKSSKKRKCCRCRSWYKVDIYNEAMSKVRCVYHYGKAYPRFVGRQRQMTYSCCESDIEASGCTVCENGHVYNSNRWTDNSGFVQTLAPIPGSQNTPPHSESIDFAKFLPDVKVRKDWNQDEVLKACREADLEAKKYRGNVYALDCEMVYTTEGYELARVTVINTYLDVVYENIVRPNGILLDPNTRFSGIKESDINSSTAYITDVQLDLMNIFDSDSILMGHSLENDLASLKIIHEKVIDTSLIFPHRMGLPKKRALKNIVSDILHMSIQNDPNGHDSKEDAVAVMQLLHQKASERIRRSRILPNKVHSGAS